MNHIPRRLQSCSERGGWWRVTGGCGQIHCTRDPGRARGVSQGPPKLLARHTRHFYNQEKYMCSLNPASKHASADGLDAQASGGTPPGQGCILAMVPGVDQCTAGPQVVCWLMDPRHANNPHGPPDALGAARGNHLRQPTPAEHTARSDRRIHVLPGQPRQVDTPHLV